MRLIAVTLTAILLLSFNALKAQDGDEFFDNKDYQRAKLAYEREVKSDPSKYFNLAQCHFALLEFDEAIVAMNNYKEKYSSADKDLANKWLALLQRDDERIKVENLGPMINSSKDEYVPRVLQDGKTLYFVADGKTGGEGGEDIWYSTLDDNGEWREPVNFSKLNTSSHEGILAISPDENVAIVFGNYTGTFGGGDLFYSVRQDDNWTPPCNLGGAINTDGWESLACIGPDGKTLIFCTDKGDGNESDLWVTFLSEEGWSKPKNLGTVVNTTKEEKYPFLSADGKTLYFSSDGHFGFGGYDVFVSRRLDDTWENWSEPVNLGKYINTLDNDLDLSIPASGKKAYITRGGRADGYGGQDIYEFLMPFSMRPEQLFVLSGNVYDENDSAVQVNIRFIDMETKEDVTKVTSRADDGSYVASLPLNRKYLAVIDMSGYLYYSEVIDLSDPSKYQTKTYFQQKIASQKGKLQALKQKLDELNLKIDALANSNSEDINKAFEEYEQTLNQYRKTLDEIDRLVYEAKYNWMTEDTDDLKLKKDFKVQSAKIGAKFELKNIFFDVGKATLREESKDELDKLYEIMEKSEIVIELGGHTDSVGTTESNQALSQDRVNSVKKYLTDKGISADRMQAVGYGESQPIASNSTEEGRQMNRRVEVKILRLQQLRVGSDTITDDDRKKPKEEPVVAQVKGDMLPILQAAARNGGLPSGSACNNIDYDWTRDAPKPATNTNPDNPWDFDKSPITRSQNIFKAFNVSLVNYQYKNVGFNNDVMYENGSQGINLTLVNKKLNETSFEYYYANDDAIGMGVGFSHIRTLQMKPFIGFPFNYLGGIEFRAFTISDTTAQFDDETAIWNLNVPIGFRMVLPVQQKLIVAPEFMWGIGVAKNKTYLNKAGYIRVGANVRWRILHAGLHLYMGKGASFLGYRLGVSF